MLPVCRTPHQPHRGAVLVFLGGFPRDPSCQEGLCLFCEAGTIGPFGLSFRFVASLGETGKEEPIRGGQVS
jgi:hypothetical protein